MSPRRSSRARGTHPPTAPTNSSTSSISSGRAERSTRSHNKVSSPQRSGPRSQSLDDQEEGKLAPRRTRSGQEDTKESIADPPDDEDEDEEEVTRCLCGQAEFPGLPSPAFDTLKQQAKENGSTGSAEAAADETAGIFIQCDTCKVWQHGGCVGILTDDEAPDNYFCEECRKDLHQMATTSNGQKYSRYLPLQATASPATSPAPQTRDSRSTRAKDAKPRASAEALAAKRRPTMNSYDEDEQLQRAIEESKKDGLKGSDEGERRPKRSRSDSEEQKAPTKRQRTGSESSSHDVEKANIAISSSDEALAALQKSRDDSPKKIRGAAAKNHREKELREQRERERQDAASRRKARSDRRRGDDSEGEEQSKDPTSNMSTPPAPDPQPRSHKKKPTGKAKRTGRNQYTRDLPASSLNNSLDPNDGAQTRARSRSRSVVRETESPRGNANTNGTTSHSGPFGGDSRPSKPKYLHITRTSFNEMKKRVAGILEFVNRAQEESAKALMNGGSSNSTAKIAETTIPTVNGVKDEIHFAGLDTQDMLLDLKGRLVRWEDEYGRWPRA